MPRSQEGARQGPGISASRHIRVAFLCQHSSPSRALSGKLELTELRRRGKAMHCKRPKALLQIQGSRCACKRDFLRLGSVAKPARCFDCLSLLICASLLTGPGAGGGIKATACLRTVTRIDTSSRKHVEIAPLLKLYLFLHSSEVILAPPFPQDRSWGGTGTAQEQ